MNDLLNFIKMYKNLIFFLLLLTATNLFAQKSVDATIVLKTNDTIRGKMHVRTNLFNDALIPVTSFYKKVIIETTKNQIITLKPDEIKELTFIDFFGDKRIFVHKEIINNQLIEQVHKNKIEWYKVVNYDAYNNREYPWDLIYDIDKNIYKLSIYSNYKKQMKKITRDNPEINKFIDDNRMNNHNILEVIKLYENLNL